MNIKVLDVSDIGDPQVLAMLQAFYSRSPMPIEERLASLAEDAEGKKEDKIRNAIKRYYVDYGHASIGECGGATVFIEGISMLAAKAIQDHPLYVGQECSTRYIDFTNQPIVTTSSHASEVANDFKKLYLEALPYAYGYARKRYPIDLVVSSKIPEEQRKDSYARTCKAIAFDYCRGLLPAGATTSVAWTANFRVFNDHLRYLARHPLAEVRNLAAHLYEELSGRYKSSFKAENLYLPQDPIERYYNLTGEDVHPHVASTWVPDSEEFIRSFMNGAPSKYGRHESDHVMYFHIQGNLDFGSYRDLQRHRNGQNRMPLLTPNFGMHAYYQTALIEMDPVWPDGFSTLVEKSEAAMTRLRALTDSQADLQYACPMGMIVPTKLTWSLGQLRYVVALRTKTSVHPTLREYLFNVVESMPYSTKSNIARSLLNVDRSPHYAASDRGEQTIKERKDATNA